MVAQVIVDVVHTNVARPFSYLIPDGMPVCVGMRVLVPLGRRQVDGFVVDIMPKEQADVPPEKLKPDINDAFADILNHGMQQDPKKRFTSAEQMLSALNKLTKSTKRYKRMRRGQDLAVIFCVMLFAAGAAAFYLGGQGKLTSYIETSISDAKALYAAGQYEDTINTLNASILEKPYVQEDMALGETYYLIGNSFLQLEQYADAANQLRSAVFYRSDQADYYRDYGIALVRSGNIDLAD